MQDRENKYEKAEVIKYLSEYSPLSDLVNHPAFDGGGRLLLPWYGRRENLGDPFNTISNYMIYHSCFDTPSMLASVNRLVADAAEGRQVFYPVYSEHERRANPRLNLQKAGVPAEIQVFPNLGHGFGLGIGSSAEGWINDARTFWEREGLR